MKHQDCVRRYRGEFSAQLQQAVRKAQAVRRFAQEDCDPCRVLPGLFIGSIGAARNAQALHREGITHILNASPLVPCLYRRQFRYKVIEVFDDASEDISQHFAETNRYISKARRKGGILIHCYAGVSRSATFVLAYLIAIEKLDLSGALQLLRSARPCAAPNTGFMAQLQEFSQKQNLSNPSDLSRALVKFNPVQSLSLVNLYLPVRDGAIEAEAVVVPAG